MDDLSTWLRSLSGRLYKRIRKKLVDQFGPAISVGDKRRVYAVGEIDPDSKRLSELGRTWSEMLRDDPWMLRLMVHVRLACMMTGIFFLCIVLGV